MLMTEIRTKRSSEGFNINNQEERGNEEQEEEVR